MQSESEIPGTFAFLQAAQQQCAEVAAQNLPTVAAAALEMSGKLGANGRLFGFGCGHSGLVSQDAYYRAGGLRGFTHIFCPPVGLDMEPVAQSSVEEKRSGWVETHLEARDISANDVVVVISTSGVNAVPVEAALHVKSKGALLVAITSVEASSALPPRHESGQKLMDLADFVLDNRSPYGDALVNISGVKGSMGSASTMAGCLLLQSLILATQEFCVKNGRPLATYVSGNVPGGMETNARDQ